MGMAESKVSTENITNIKQPSKYKVVFNNDDATPMEFVIGVLKGVFHHSDEAANTITMEIHNNGKGIAGIYTYEIAEQKHNESTFLARTNGHPLNINLESD